jgi:phosphoribosyl-dephospho-CoA transferase
VRPHDLLRLADGAGISYEGSVPAWVPASLTWAPWVVVRRARIPTALIPVGIRGSTRAERLAAFLDPTAVTARVTPEGLATVRAWQQTPATHSADALLRVLNTAEELFASQNLVWGPTGSVGFKLATGITTVGPTSDLDMVIRAPEPWPPERARGLADALARLPMPVDVQLDTPAGAVALTEYARGGRVLLRTPDGPKLVRDPWERITADR